MEVSCYDALPVDNTSEEPSLYPPLPLCLTACLLFAKMALAHCAMALPAVLSQGRSGHRLRRASCVKLGAGSLVWKFPVKSSDRLPGGATQKLPGYRDSSDAMEESCIVRDI